MCETTDTEKEHICKHSSAQQSMEFDFKVTVRRGKRDDEKIPREQVSMVQRLKVCDETKNEQRTEKQMNKILLSHTLCIISKGAKGMKMKRNCYNDQRNRTQH